MVEKKVVQSNDLIMSVARMDQVPLKIFELAVAQIDLECPPENNTITLSKKTLFDFFNVTDTNKHNRFKEAILKLHRQAIFQIDHGSVKGKYNFQVISPLAKTEWNDYNDDIKIKFTEDIMPYLIDLKTRFTQYAIKDLMYLNSKYSIILYKFLSMNYNQFEHYEYSLKRTKSQLNSYKNPIISIKELRRLTDTENEYNRFTNFDSWVLKKPLKEISEHTHFDVTYEKIKHGRSVESVQFFIKKKKVAENSFYKEEQQDTIYLVDKATKEQKRLEKFVAAQQNPYTQLLLTNRLLDFSDIVNMELLLEVSQHVYPLYDELVALTDNDRVNIHMAYVNDKKLDYSHQNKPKYLRKAIQDYLITVKLKA